MRTKYRSERLVIRGLPALLATLTTLNPATLVLDVDPMVTPWNSPPELFAQRADELASMIRLAVPDISVIVFASNSPRYGLLPHEGINLISPAWKPWTTSYLRSAARPLVVVGDQILTDGLLARRAQGTFLHWQGGGPTPLWPRLQKLLGKAFIPCCFRSQL